MANFTRSNTPMEAATFMLPALLLLLLSSLLATSATSLPDAGKQLSSQDVVAPETAVDGTDAAGPSVPQVLDVAASVGDTKACAAVGEFCLLSEQCCTKRCLTYLARCVS